MKNIINLVSFIVLATVMVDGVLGHTFLMNLVIDGKALDKKECIRPTTGAINQFVASTTDVNLRCRPGNQSPSATNICPVQAGSKMGVVWQRSTNAQTDNVIAPSHHGPCLVYMARMDKPIDDPVWFKVYEQGYDSDSKLWCTDVLRANNGLLEFTIPADIRSGDYLLRTEIIALHAASKLGKVQFYPNCAQLSVEGSGSADPKGYSIPGIYKADDPGLLFNLYKPYTNYTIPGPPIYEAGSE